MDKVKLIWDIHHDCNYRCPYCWFYGKWKIEKKDNLYLELNEWLLVWDKIYQKYGSVHIDITGGEPFIYPSFIELLKILSEKHTLMIVTNLSFSLEKFLSADLSPDRVKLGISFHPLFANLDTFLDKAKLLKEKGFCESVNFVAYPPQIYMISSLRQRFEENGLGLAIQPFWGEYNKKSYPGDFTDQERKLIDHLIEDQNYIDYRINKKSPKGKVCTAGVVSANISHKGEVFRCGPMTDKYKLGNVINAEFTFLDKPQVCTAEACPCEEFLKLEDSVSTNRQPDQYEQNLKLSQQEIDQKKLSLLSKPRKLFVMPTRRCNLDCLMCPRVDNSQSDLDPRIMDQVVELFPYLDFIEWQGGEVFLYKDFNKILEKTAVYPRIKQVITTNGLMINQEWADLIVNNNIELRVSIDAVTPEIYEHIRKGGSFDRLRNNLNLLNEKMRQADKKDILGFMLVVLMKSNYMQIDTLIDFAKNNNFRHIIFNTMNPGKQEAEAEDLFASASEEVISSLRMTFNKYAQDPFVVVMPSVKNKIENNKDVCNHSLDQAITSDERTIFCQMPWINLFIEPNVLIAPHCYCFKEKESFSPDTNTTLLDMWNGKVMRSYREKIKHFDYQWCNQNDCLSRDSDDPFFKGCI